MEDNDSPRRMRGKAAKRRASKTAASRRISGTYAAPVRCQAIYTEVFRLDRKADEKIQVEAAERLNLGRHAAKCRICTHARRQEIEEDYFAWKSPTQIAQDYGLADRSSVYRHAVALNLYPKCRRNLRTPLERIIEQAGDIKANASAIVAAVQIYARINAHWEMIEPDEHLELHDLFDRMKPEEYDAYAKDGTLPTWFQDEIAAAGGRVPKGEDDV